jgi:hypothetical protein
VLDESFSKELISGGIHMINRYGVPEIYEQEAKGLLKAVYTDIQFTLKVPVVNFIFRTLGLYERFLAIGWDQVKPNMLTVNMEQAAEDLRYPDLSLEVPHINWSEHYSEEQLEMIRRIVFTFNYVNTKLLLIASAWAESLSNRPILGKQNLKGYIEPGIIPGLPKVDLVQVNQAPPAIQDLLLDIAKKHHAFDVASDFRTLAHFPDFLSISWQGLAPYVGSEEYQRISSQLKSKSIALLNEMPFPVTVNRDRLELMYSRREIAGIMGVVSMFQNFLPGLIIDGEYFRRMVERRSSR